MTMEFKVESDKIPVIGTITRKFAVGLRELLILVVIFVLVFICITLAVLLGRSRRPVTSDTHECLTKPCLDKPCLNKSCLDKPCLNKSCPVMPCLDKLCLDSVSYVLSNLKTDKKPCDNFYQYACGSYSDLHSVNPDQKDSALIDVMQKNTDRIERILLRSQDANDWSSERKVKDLYKSCLDDFTTERLRGRPFLDSVVGRLGGAYFLGTWNNATFSLADSLKTLQTDLGVDAFWKFGVERDVANDLKHRLIELLPFGLSRHLTLRHYLGLNGPKAIQHYKKFMYRVASLLLRDSGVVLNDTSTRLRQFITDVWYIESRIVRLAVLLPWTKNPYENENQISLSKLTTLTNNTINWVSQVQYQFKGFGVSGMTKIVVHNVGYMKAMTALIKKLMDSNQHRVLHNYMMWRAMETYVQDLSWEYIHANREMYVDIHGQPNFLGKKKYCFYRVTQEMPEAVGAVFVANHFADKNKGKISDITTAIKDEVLLLLDKTPWMDEATRQKAKNKLSKTEYKIGYPELYRQQKQLDIIYHSVTINESDYFGNILRLVAYKRTVLTSELKNGENMDKWYYKVFDTALASVFYLNQIVLPAGLLQFPVYDYRLPHYMTFGSMGTFIGRFLLHLVDEKGRHWSDANGYLGDNKTWWSDKTNSSYAGVKSCFVKQYNKEQWAYKTPGQTLSKKAINSSIYAFEALATSSGIRASYKAYKQWTEHHRELYAPNDLHLSNSQMFFLSFAQTWCTNRGQLNLYNLVQGGKPREEIRVNYALKDLKEFSEAFHCSEGSPMNPREKCQLF